MKDNEVTRLTMQLKRNVIDRRQFVMSALAAGVTLPVALSMADSVRAATPQSGGHLRVGVSDASTSESLDPATMKTQTIATNGWRNVQLFGGNRCQWRTHSRVG